MPEICFVGVFEATHALPKVLRCSVQTVLSPVVAFTCPQRASGLEVICPNTSVPSWPTPAG